MRITGARSNRLIPLSVRKFLTTSRASTTTHEADPELVLSLIANTKYLITSGLIITGGDAAGDFSYSWAWTGTMSVIRTGVGPAETIASGAVGDGNFGYGLIDSGTPTGTINYVASSAGANAQPTAWVEVGATAGDLTLRWAQASSNASNTSLNPGSWIMATPMGFS